MNKKLLIIILSAMFIIIIIMKLWDWKVKHDQEQAYFNVQKDRVTLYMKYNLKDFKSITFTKTGTDPMGGKFIEGYVNNNKRMEFRAETSSADNFEFNGELILSEGIADAFKKDEKDVDQIKDELEIKDSKNNRLE